MPRGPARVIAVRTKREIEALREANGIVAEVLAVLVDLVEPGITTGELDARAEALIRELGGIPSFLGYRGYPKATCISVDEEVVHGIPGRRKLRAGEIVSMDVGAFYKGYHGDAALSVPCGVIDEGRQRLLETADRALGRAVAAAPAGADLQSVSRVIQETCEAEGFSVVRAFVGHGIGTELHEEPQIPNFVTGERGPRLRAGMVLAIEPMVNMGTAELTIQDDGWTAVTADGKPSAHFEHSVAVGKECGDILSATPKLVWGRP